MQSHPFADHRGLLWQKVQRRLLESCLNFFTLVLLAAQTAFSKCNVLGWNVRVCFFYVSLETSVRMARVPLRRSALRSSWWSCPISGPHPCTWQTNSVRVSGGRNWDVCLKTKSHDHMLDVICGWRTAFKLTAAVFLCSFIQHAWHRQWWDDNPRGVQTCKPPLSSVDKEMQF